MKFHNQIFLAMLLGALVGSLSSADSALFGIPLLALHDLLGTLFINALKMVVVPLIASALAAAVMRPDQHAAVGKKGGMALFYYTTTSFLAVCTAVLLNNLINPGIIDGKPAGERMGLEASAGEVIAQLGSHELGDFAKVFYDLLPPNIIEAAASNQLLGIIVFSFLFGWCLRPLSNPAAATLRDMIDAFYQVMMNMTLLVIRFAPIGVYALIAKTVTQTGYQAVLPLAWFFVTVLAGLLLHSLGSLALILKIFARRSPTRLLKASAPALLTAFSSSSSSGTLPLTMKCLQQRAGISRETTNFMTPLGTALNMDGTALYECAVVLFIAQAYGLELSLIQQLMIVVLAVVTSIGVAGIPSASLVAITLILTTVGLPAEAIGLIMATDRLLDMFRTSVNVWSDCIGAALVARLSGEEDVLSLPPDQLEARFSERDKMPLA